MHLATNHHKLYNNEIMQEDFRPLLFEKKKKIRRRPQQMVFEALNKLIITMV